MNQRLPLNNISNQFKNQTCEYTVNKLLWNKENIKFNLSEVVNKSSHEESINQFVCWSSFVAISGNEETFSTFESKSYFDIGEDPGLATELLRETHGCETYLLLRECP